MYLVLDREPYYTMSIGHNGVRMFDRVWSPAEQMVFGILFSGYQVDIGYIEYEDTRI